MWEWERLLTDNIYVKKEIVQLAVFIKHNYKSFCKSFEIVENAENSLQMAFVFHFSIFFTNTFVDFKTFDLKSKRLQNSKFYNFGIIAGTNYLMLIFISGYLSDKIYIFDLLKPEYTLIVYHTKLFFDTKIGGPSYIRLYELPKIKI